MKKTIVISMISAAVTGLVVSIIMLHYPGLSKETLPNWLSALGTIGAVWFAVTSRTDKAKLKINAEFVYHENYEAEIEGFTRDDLGKMEPIYTGGYTNVLDSEGHVLTIYISNVRQSSGLITEWGLIDDAGTKRLLSSEPIVIPGFEVRGITRTASHIEDKYDYAIDQINTYKSEENKFKLYFQDVNDKEYCCDIAERKITNRD